MGVVVKLDAVDLQVEPGSETSLTVEVTNTGSIVERFEIAVVGPLAGWATVDPPALNLDAGVQPTSDYDSSSMSDRAAAATGTTRVTFRIPRSHNPRADTYDFGVYVRATADPTVAFASEGKVTVLPFVELETEVVPETSRGSFSGRHELFVRNRGGAVADLSVTATQVNRELKFSITPRRVGILPGEAASVRIRARAKDTFLMGPPKQVPFQVKVEEPLAGNRTIPAYLEQRAIIPSWIKPLAGLIVGGIALIALGPPILVALHILPGPSPSLSAVESPQATIIVTEAPTMDPITPEPLTAPPSAPPTFGPPDQLTATGDDTDGLNPDLVNIERTCTGRKCRLDKVAPRVVQGLTGLQGVAIGALLDRFTVSKPGTLVVQASWDNPHPFLDSNGVVLGRATDVAFDLAPLLVEGGKAYVRIRNTDGLEVSYFVPTANADLLLQSLYLVEPGTVPTPDPNASFDPNLGGFYERATLWGAALRTIRFVP